MRIQLENLSSPKLHLTLPAGNQQERVLAVEHISELRGVLERSADVLGLRSAALRECQVMGVTWPLSRGGIFVGAPAAVSELDVDVEIALRGADRFPVLGRVAFALVDGEDVRVELADTRVSADVRIERLAAHSSASERGTSLNATVASLGLRNVQTALGDLLCRVGGVGAEQARLAWHRPAATGAEQAPGGSLPEVHAGALALVDVTLAGADIDIRADQIELAQGVELVDGELRIEHLRIGELTVTLDDLSPWTPRAAPGRAAGAGSDAPRGPALELLDLLFLDRLEGKIDVDMTVDAALPIIGVRSGSHHFRLPIAEGALNYRQLEDGLACLEDAVLDFEIRDHELVLERDLPIISLRKDLVCWRLDDDEYALAQQRLVRLRTLPNFEIAEAVDDSGVELRRLSIDALDVDLATGLATGLATSLASASPGSAGTASSAGDRVLSDIDIGRCQIRGSLGYPAGEPHTICVTAESLAARIHDLGLGEFGTLSGDIAVERIADARLCFDGLQPRTLAATIHGVELRNVVVRLGPSRPQ